MKDSMLPSKPLISYFLMGSLLTSSFVDSYIRGASASNATFLDAQSLQRHEQSIVSSLRDGSAHRSLQSYNCMQDLFGSSLANGCTANDVEFVAVTGVVVYDPGAYQDEVRLCPVRPFIFHAFLTVFRRMEFGKMLAEVLMIM